MTTYVVRHEGIDFLTEDKQRAEFMSLLYGVAIEIREERVETLPPFLTELKSLLKKHDVKVEYNSHMLKGKKGWSVSLGLVCSKEIAKAFKHINK